MLKNVQVITQAKNAGQTDAGSRVMYTFAGGEYNNISVHISPPPGEEGRGRGREKKRRKRRAARECYTLLF